MDYSGIPFIFLWVMLVVLLIYIMEFLFKRQLKVAKHLNPVLVLRITKERKNLEKELKHTFFKLSDLSEKGVSTNVVVLCTLNDGESKNTVKRVCRHRNLTLVENEVQLSNFIALHK